VMRRRPSIAIPLGIPTKFYESLVVVASRREETADN